MFELQRNPSGEWGNILNRENSIFKCAEVWNIIVRVISKQWIQTPWMVQMRGRRWGQWQGLDYRRPCMTFKGILTLLCQRLTNWKTEVLNLRTICELQESCECFGITCKQILMYIFLNFEQILKGAHDCPTPLLLECTQRILEGLSAQVIKVI